MNLVESRIRYWESKAGNPERHAMLAGGQLHTIRAHGGRIHEPRSPDAKPPGPKPTGPRPLDPALVAQIQQARASGQTIDGICRLFRRSTGTIYRALAMRVF